MKEYILSEIHFLPIMDKSMDRAGGNIFHLNIILLICRFQISAKYIHVNSFSFVFYFSLLIYLLFLMLHVIESFFRRLYSKLSQTTHFNENKPPSKLLYQFFMHFFRFVLGKLYFEKIAHTLFLVIMAHQSSI